MHVEENLDHIQEMMEFIQSYDFEVEKEQWPKEAWDAFNKPLEERIDLSDPKVRLSIQYYLILSHASEETYSQFQQLYNSTHCDAPLLSYDQVCQQLHSMTGIYSLRVDKCKKNCLAYVGPWGKLSTCSKCGEERYDNKGKSCSQFTVIPLGPQLQAQYRHPKSTAKLRYRHQETQRILREGKRDWSDILHGLDYLKLVESGQIDKNTMVLLFSEDTAQLYRDKESSTRFGGLNTAQHDSFLLLTLAHIAACQRRGIKVWDCLWNRVIEKHPFLLFALADTVAMTDMSKSVGHHQRNGCQLLCNMPGRHKPGVGTYYPAMLWPEGDLPRVPAASAHPDIHVDTVTAPTVEEYEVHLQRVLEAPNMTQYKKSVLPRALPCPKLFPADLMHLYYNINQLLLQLWRGTIDYIGGDDPADWPFAILQDEDDFAAFGLAVERAGCFIATCIKN
ncbi:hypothetical protein AAF712_013433 [Marasmius tenuissimus]|uniref:HMG domain-containing protein n=1 Tax=Marasmius tenuissimus TaxID=585030 RepID=A0ABR2ZDP6_9AGAR